MSMIASEPQVKRVMVATNRTPTANRAVQWAAHLARSYGADLVLVEVLPPAPADGSATAEDETAAREALQALARDVAGSRGHAVHIHAEDPAEAILDAVGDQGADVLVLGNVGMSGRKAFLLGNIPNRVTHRARCTVVIVNTTSPTDGLSPDEAAPEVDAALLARAIKIGRILARVGLRDLRSATRGGDAAATRAAGRRLRDALDALGPTFAKLGQILSTRPDLLPPVFIEELATLQERVTPLTEAEVVAAMERELGVPWEDVFASIEPTPLAAGTIAQVHRATLENGDRVVIKVQRPTAEADITRDLELLEMLAARAGERPAFRRIVDIPAVIEHLATSLRRELDFRQEAANLQRMDEVLDPFMRLAVPKVYTEYSTARLLVMQEVQGVAVLSAPPGPARAQAAKQFLEAFYHQIMGEGFFHADPHPGNMKWWNDKIYFLDLGMVGEADRELRDRIILLVLAFAQRDAAFLTEAVLALAGARGDERVDVAAFQADLTQLLNDYRDRSLQDIHLGPLFQEVSAIAVRHHVRLPAALLLMGKAFGQMQQVASELDPSLDPFGVAQEYLFRRTLRQVTDALTPQAVFYEMQKLKERLTRVLEGVESLLSATSGGKLQVQVRGAEQLESAVTQASQRLSLALGLSAVMVAATTTATSRHVPRWIPAVLSGIGAVLAARLAADGTPRRD